MDAKIISMENRHKLALEEYKNGLQIKKICEIYNIADRVIYNAIKTGDIEKRKTQKQKDSLVRFERISQDKDFLYYLAGLIATDGYVHSTKNSMEMCTHPQDEDVLKKVSLIVYGENRVIRDKTINRTRLFIHCREYKEFLADLGIHTRKSTNLDVEVDKIPREYFGSFLRGFMDGDGYYQVRTENNIVIKLCGTLATMTSLKDKMMEYYNIPCSVFQVDKERKYISFPFYNLTVSKTFNSKSLIHILYDYDNPVYIERKFNIIHSYIAA